MPATNFANDFFPAFSFFICIRTTLYQKCLFLSPLNKREKVNMDLLSLFSTVMY